MLAGMMVGSSVSVAILAAGVLVACESRDEVTAPSQPAPQPVLTSGETMTQSETMKVARNDGSPHTVTVPPMTFQGRWTVRVLDATGAVMSNDKGANSYSSDTARRNTDGSTTLNFGGCSGGPWINCFPISAGWTYEVDVAVTSGEIGNWQFPKPVARN